jgi:magnesium transporter
VAVERVEQRPWYRIEELVGAGDGAGLERFLAELSPGDTARAFANLSADLRQQVLMLLSPGEAAAAIEELPEPQAADLVEELPAEEAAAIVARLPSQDQADLLSELDPRTAEAILAELPRDEAERARELAAHEPDRAGGLMITEHLAYPASARVRDIVDDLRRNAERYRRYDIQYGYVVGPERRLVGVVPLRELLLFPLDTPVRDFMLEPRALRAETGLDELRDFFDAHPFVGAPVVDAAGRLLGVVPRAEVGEALSARAERDHLKATGIVGGDELRTMPLGRRASRRLSWLSVNVVLNVLAASVIALFQDTVQTVIALAVFLPIISDMSGCSGNQAVAVTLRELTSGLVRPLDALRVLRKELGVGLVNGIALGALVGGAAWLWKGNPYLGLVIAAAMSINTLVSVCVGGIVPLGLKRLGVDPAIASGPLLTTITDMCGFLLVLGLATLMLPRLMAG